MKVRLTFDFSDEDRAAIAHDIDRRSAETMDEEPEESGRKRKPRESSREELTGWLIGVVEHATDALVSSFRAAHPSEDDAASESGEEEPSAESTD